MANMKVDSEMLSKGLDMANNAMALANAFSKKPTERKTYMEGDKTEQPHNQTVEVKVGQTEAQQKPVIVHDKKETHIHKPFPDGRALTKDECEVEKLRINAALEDSNNEREFRMQLEEKNREERREREAYARKERERKREEDKRFTRRLLIGSGVCIAALVGISAYGVYTDSRRPAGSRLALPKPEVNVSISGEGTVK